MSQCTECGTNFVGTPENPPQPGLCKYCEIKQLKSKLAATERRADDATAKLKRFMKGISECVIGFHSWVVSNLAASVAG